ncbi:hypothetical protein MNBD_DELTA01-200 [hydrothermal vent metagenome]|uniref:M23ase beta-sheet core domain-containing protein n=1 Tax=hydrothermal vent metagenome TaxID=652676 RepID=A0A3B0RA36_9ZZZZ
MGKLEFIRPIDDFKEISSLYGMRTDPFTGLQKFHYGIDYKTVEEGKKIKASEGGKVIRAALGNSTGETIIIDHTPKAKDNEEHIYTQYAHLKEDNAYEISINDRVERGKVIGYSGNTGNSTGAHLHFAVIRAGTKLVWNTGAGPTWISPSGNNYFKNPAAYIDQEHEIGGTIYDLSEEEHKKVTESLDVKMHLDFPNHSWYGDVYLNKKKVGRIDKDSLDLMAELDEIMKTTSFPERESVLV